MLQINSKSNTKALKRILQILDEGSFMELGEKVVARKTDFYEPDSVSESDGVITGHGTIDNNLVYIFSQDSQVTGGTFGEMHGKKIIELYKRAIKSQAPIIGIIDCNGFRIEEGLDGLDVFGQLYAVQAKAKRIIPQVMVVSGRCGGGMSIAANMADFLMVEKNAGTLFLHNHEESPMAIEEEMEITSEIDGTMEFDEIVSAIRNIIDILPANIYQGPEVGECTDDLNRLCTDIEANKDDGKKTIEAIADDNLFFETRRGKGQDVKTGFIKINGCVVGAIASHNGGKEGNRLTAEGCDKASGLINFCDKYGIPILTITNTDGFATGKEEEKYLPKAAGRLIKALTYATVPKVNLITGNLTGSSYSLMNCKGIGADYVFVWDTAKVNIINPAQAMEIIYSKEIASGALGGEQLKEKLAEYEEIHSGAMALARHGYVDKIIQPQDSRKYVIGALETFANV